MNTLSKILTVVAAGMISAQAMAASQGTVGSSSTGTSDVSITVNDLVRITSVADISLTYSGGGPLVGSTQYCVFRNGGDQYKVTLTTDQGAFEVTSGTTSDTIPFTVNVDDDIIAGGGETLSYNTASSVALLGSASANCGGADNGEVEVNFAEADLQAVTSASDYNATMTILVEPI
ncbi:MAG: hypothetical protein HUJ31_19690 [Pseudomonadales bacterium]|nr:hypothetical protein [Pseudomonadales bacterium]